MPRSSRGTRRDGGARLFHRRRSAGKTAAKLLLAALTLLLFAAEGVYLLAARAAMRCGWEPGKRNVR